jgi:hypothetical protein
MIVSQRILMRRLHEKVHIQGAQDLMNEAYLLVRCSDEGCSANQELDFS